MLRSPVEIVLDAISGQTRVFRDFTLRQVSYSAGASLPLHAHENAVLSFAITGGTMVSVGSVTEWCDHESLLCLPAGAAHANAYPEAATRFHVEVTARFWNEAAEERPIPLRGPVRHAVAGELRRAVIAAFADIDNLVPLDLALSLTDAIGLLACGRPAARFVKADHWLMQLRDFLTAHCAEPLSMRQLTRITGRHPVHISREFRNHFGKTVSQFVRERRLLRAARLVGEDSLPLPAIAVECGFYDQSHFTNAFRRFVGMTPSAYRASLRVRSSACTPRHSASRPPDRS